LENLDDLPAAVTAGSRSQAMAQMSMARFILGQGGFGQDMMGAPVCGMRTGMSHSYHHSAVQYSPMRNKKQKKLAIDRSKVTC